MCKLQVQENAISIESGPNMNVVGTEKIIMLAMYIVMGFEYK